MMKSVVIGCIVLFYCTSLAHATCVFESDFGFILNCNFKKTGLFRVRNLGGVKAHFGLGFSVGDELGLNESLGNVEGNKRRALNVRTSPNNIGVLPASRLPEPNTSPYIQQSKPQAVTITAHTQRAPLQQKYNKSLSQMTQAASLPLGVPAFRPIPPAEERAAISNPVTTEQLQTQPVYTTSAGSYVTQSHQLSTQENQTSLNSVPTFQSMPSSSVSRISTGQIYHVDNAVDSPSHHSTLTLLHGGHHIEALANVASNQQLPEIDLMGHSVDHLAKIANVSVEAIQVAIQQRQQQLLLQQEYVARKQELQKTTTAEQSLQTTTTKRPRHNYQIVGSKVMNAPKEYYPVGYDKNFDDNFMTKVDLPTTSFQCGNQKHFPGLYGDIDLGCMVFHVCALTDDGLIMKSFLCPESTLFDQTILKCNWWFYVDCKSSKNLYDSNLPVSKSYQLMKALTFFSGYKNTQNERDTVDIEALKNSVTTSKNN